MNRIAKRAVSVLMLAAFLLCGVALYVYNYIKNGADWAAFQANPNTHSTGRPSVGQIYDRNGELLLKLSDKEYQYSNEERIRISTVHAVGDYDGNIGTGAVSMFQKELSGFDPVFGTTFGHGGTVTLSLDAKLNTAAYRAMNGRAGTAAVCDCDTGELLCMVSTPAFDPQNLPDDYENGAFINRFLSSVYTPGSIFKLVTLAAALETVPGIEDMTFHCSGSYQFGNDIVNCMGSHGKMTLEEAFSNSCNCAFAEISLLVGGDTLLAYAKAFGLTDSISVNGLQTAAGHFEAVEEQNANLAWSGIGQYTDLVCPAAFLRFVSAVENEGIAPSLTLLKTTKPNEGTRIIDKETASKLKAIMKAAGSHYAASEKLEGMTLYAKSGTAELSSGLNPHAVFTGFAEYNGRHLGFFVLVENGGYGSSTAGQVAAEILKEAIA